MPIATMPSNVPTDCNAIYKSKAIPIDRSLFCQRAFDIVVGGILLLAAIPVIAIAIIVVRLTSHGPAIYSQVRLGRFGKPFLIYKVRSMTHDCERGTGAQWSSKGDVRVTAVGRVLRITHVDELPQLFNILCGQMSLIGPRPERPEFVTALQSKLPHYHERLAVRPGLTGLAQVQLPPDSDLDSVRRKIRYDLRYVATGNLWMDCRLLVATIIHVVGLPYSVSRLLLGLPGQPEVEPEREPKTSFGAPTIGQGSVPLHTVYDMSHEVAVDASRA